MSKHPGNPVKEFGSAGILYTLRKHNDMCIYIYMYIIYIYIYAYIIYIYMYIYIHIIYIYIYLLY